MAIGPEAPIRAARARQSRNKAYGGKLARQLERFDNLIALFTARAEEKGDAPFLWAKRDGEWKPTSWAEAARQVASLAASLKRIGLEPGDRVALVSENRPEWLISDLAIMAAGCVTVPTYTTNTTRGRDLPGAPASTADRNSR